MSDSPRRGAASRGTVGNLVGGFVAGLVLDGMWVRRAAILPGQPSDT